MFTEDQVGEFIKKGYVIVPLDVARHVPPVIDGFMKLLDEPDEVRQLYTLDLDGKNPPDPDDGLIRREGKPTDGKESDLKWFFHYRPRVGETIVMRRLPNWQSRIHWLGFCQVLYETALGTITRFAQVIDQKMPGYELERHLCEGRGHVLRLIRYDRNTPGGLIAKSHTDRDAVTLHIADSQPGLEYGNPVRQYITSPDRALIFAGDKVQAITKEKIPALWHDAIQTAQPGEETKYRWVAVFFTHIDL